MATAPIIDDEDEGDIPDQTERLMEVHERAMERFDSVAVPQREMRGQSLRDRRFVTIEGAMWEDDWAALWPETAPKPEIDKITKSLEKIETDHRENRMMVQFVPDDDAEKDTAETLEGMYRADNANFSSQQARDNAFQEGIRGGFGAWRVTTAYDDPYDPDNDSQRVNPAEIIVDADQSVYLDGGSVLYDGSDAEWGFVVSAKPRADAVKEWGEDAIADWPVSNWQWQWDWYTPDVVLEAEYYEIEDDNDKLLIFTQEQSGEERRFFRSEIEDGVSADLKAQGWTRRVRSIKRKRVHKYVMNGTAVLKDCGYIDGDNIPIVPFYGRRDWVDKLPRWRGHVRKRIDDQRSFNAQMGRLIETSSLSPIRTPIMYDDETTPTIAQEWANRNQDRLAFLRRVRVWTPDGQPVPSQLEYLEPPSIAEATATLLQLNLGSLTDSDDNADQVHANTSADAMDIAAMRVDAKSAIYLDNMRQSIAREGQVYMGMAREVYYEPKRIVQTMTADGQQGSAMLQEEIVDQNGVYRTRNDITKGRFKVYSDVEESTTTKRQKTVRQFETLAQAFGPGSPDARIMLLNAIRNMDGEAIDETQDWAREQLIAAGVIKPTPEEQQQLAMAAQNAKPDPAAIALTQEAAKTAAEAQEKLAKARLENAQAETLEKAPPVPTGLANAPEPNNPVEDASKLASARLNLAKANHLEQDAHHQRIRMGRDLANDQHEHVMDVAGHALAERQQDHVESQPTNTGS